MKALLLAFAAIAIGGCGLLPYSMDPHVSETRFVSALNDSSMRISVPEGMIWYDSAMKSSGLRFPEGGYLLEAEDEEYWYFRAPSPLEFRKFSSGRMVDGRDIPGGLMYAKNQLSAIPAAAYIDGENNKMMVWKLGRDFQRREGASWTKTF